jgi:hypothetical protein
MNPTNDDINKLIRVLTEAGWIARCDNTIKRIDFTPMGLERMDMLAAALPAFKNINRGGQTANDTETFARLLPDLIVTVRELQMPISFAPLLMGFVAAWKQDTRS